MFSGVQQGLKCFSFSVTKPICEAAAETCCRSVASSFRVLFKYMKLIDDDVIVHRCNSIHQKKKKIIVSVVEGKIMYSSLSRHIDLTASFQLHEP